MLRLSSIRALFYKTSMMTLQGKVMAAAGSDMIFVIREESAGGGYSNSYHQIRSSNGFTIS